MPELNDPRLPDRFWSKVRVSDSGCWEWTGAQQGGGYGAFGVASTPRPAHRIAYSALVGPISEGLVLDHLCRVRLCVNPAHLEPVTNRVNVLRGVAPTVLIHLAPTCSKGHEKSPENSRTTPKGTTRCRVCDAANWQKQYADPAFRERRQAALKDRKRPGRRPCLDCTKATTSLIQVCTSCQMARRRAA